MIIPDYVINESIVKREINGLNNVLIQQRQLKKTLLLYLEKISEGIYNSSNPQDTDQIHSFLESVQKCFDKLKENMNRIIELKLSLENTIINGNYEEFDYTDYNNKCSKLLEKINLDNSSYYSFMDSLFEYINVTFPEVAVENKPVQQEVSELYTSQITIEDIQNQIEKKFEEIKIEEPTTEEVAEKTTEETTENVNEENTVQESEKQNAENSSSVESSANPAEEASKPEKVLFISHKKEYAILPYSTADLEKTFSDSPEKYSSLQDIIDKEYTISLKDYKFDSSSVYEECYNLAKKENYNSIKAMMFANNAKKLANVNPIIIRACKTVEEAEFYLKCVENNTLEYFTLFKIVEE